MASTDATPSPVKAQAFSLEGPIYLTTGKKLSGAAGLVAKIIKDRGTSTTATNTLTEIGTSGIYYLDITATEMNADTVAVSWSSTTTNAMDSDFIIPTQSAGKIKVDLQTWLTGTPNALSSGRVDASVGAYPGNTAQTGDSYARIGATGSGLTSLAPASTALSTAVWTAPPTGFLTATFPTSVGTSTLTQAQVTGGPYAINSSSFAFNAALPFTTAQLDQTVKANVVAINGDTSAPSPLADFAADYGAQVFTASIVGNVQGDVEGKVLGGGVSAFVGSGANVNVTSISDEGTGNLFLLLNDYASGQLNADLTGKVLGSGASAFAGNGAQVSVSGVATSSELAKLVSTLQFVSGSTYRFTASALLNAPSSSGTGLSGPSPVTLTYVDSNGDPVPLVEFSVVGQGVQRALVDGTASFGLNDGTYTVVSGPVGGVMFPDTALTVSGSGAATIVGYTVNIVPPSDPTLCVVYGFAVKNDGSKAANVTITFIVAANIPSKTAGGSIIAYIPVNVTSDANGFFQATLIRDKAYQINSPTLRFNGTVFTPTGSSYDLSTAIT